MEIGYEHESIRLTGRWGKTESGMTATAPGSYLEFAFEGDMAVARFDVLTNATPLLHLWIQIDGGDFVESPIDGFLRIRTKKKGLHVVKIIYKGGTEQTHRWSAPLTGKVTFLGVQTEKPAQLPEDNRKIIEFVGDSITEGVLIDTDFAEPNLFRHYEEQSDRNHLDDVTATYAWMTAEQLNLRPYFMGYGAVGTTRSGCGGVPAAPLAYPFNFEGSPVCYADAPDYILINHGANDRYAPVETFLSAYESLLDVIRKKNPNAVLISLSMFCGTYHEEQGKLIAEYNEKHRCNVHYVDSCGWISPHPLHPLRDGHKTVAEHLVPILKEIVR